MTEISDRYDRLVQQFTDRVNAVTDIALSATRNIAVARHLGDAEPMVRPPPTVVG